MSRRGAGRSAAGGKGPASGLYAHDARYPRDRRGSAKPEGGFPRPDPNGVGESRFDYREAPELGRRVVQAAQELLRLGLSSAEVCSLFTHAAATLAEQDDGLGREEWLALCEELYDHRQEAQPRRSANVPALRVNARGGEA